MIRCINKTHMITKDLKLQRGTLQWSNSLRDPSAPHQKVHGTLIMIIGGISRSHQLQIMIGVGPFGRVFDGFAGVVFDEKLLRIESKLQLLLRMCSSSEVPALCPSANSTCDSSKAYFIIKTKNQIFD